MNQLDKKYILKRNDLLFPELSFKIGGVLIDVAKKLGGGHLEKYYQKSISLGLTNRQISFQEQMYVPLQYEGKTIGKYFLDFLIEQSIVLEIKRGQFIPTSTIQQTKQYLSALKLKLGLLAYFTQSGVIIKRVVNEY